MNMNYLADYDKTNPQSIEDYAQKLIGKTFADVVMEDSGFLDEVQESSSYIASHEDKKYKGSLGTLIEERFFHYAANSDSRPDFYEAGVELKVSPYKINSKGDYVAKERMILTMIDYFSVINEEFEDSHMWKKCRLILLIYYLYRKEITNKLLYQIDFAKLFTPPEQDKRIIMKDFYTIRDKIAAGKAHELSEGDTLYLGAATKAQTSKDRRRQPNSTELAKPRAFSFKNTYMTYVLNTYIIPGTTTYESIVNDDIIDDFESYVIGKLNKHRNKSVAELCSKYEVDITKKPKNLEALLAYKMLGIKGNKAEEFVKANIVVKVIRIGKNNKIKENMSFPAFQFNELIKENWEDSTFGNYLRDTRFFFVVYKEDDNGELHVRGGQFWNIPYEDLEIDVKNVWEETKRVISEGLIISEVNGRRINNLPKQKDNRVSHVRPHAKNAEDTYELPDGRRYTKQCFWLNNSYIYSQIDDALK